MILLNGGIGVILSSSILPYFCYIGFFLMSCRTHRGQELDTESPRLLSLYIMACSLLLPIMFDGDIQWYKLCAPKCTSLIISSTSLVEFWRI